MNRTALYIAPLVFLFAYGLITSFFLWRTECKLEDSRQENINLSVSLEIAKNENDSAKAVIKRQNGEIEKLGAVMTAAEAKYRTELSEIDSQKAADLAVIDAELARDNSAENELKLITELVQGDFLLTGGDYENQTIF